MSAMSRRKGNGYERAIVTWLRAQGRVNVERRIAGMADDRGDLTGWPGVVVEAKNHARLELAAWVDQLADEIVEADADTGVVIHKRRGTSDVGQHFATMTVDRWFALMCEAGR